MNKKKKILVLSTHFLLLLNSLTNNFIYNKGIVAESKQWNLLIKFYMVLFFFEHFFVVLFYDLSKWIKLTAPYLLNPTFTLSVHYLRPVWILALKPSSKSGSREQIQVKLMEINIYHLFTVCNQEWMRNIALKIQGREMGKKNQMTCLLNNKLYFSFFHLRMNTYT